MEYEATLKNSTSLRNALKTLQKEKSQEESQWQSLLADSRRKMAHFQSQRYQKTQEATDISTDLVGETQPFIS